MCAHGAQYAQKGNQINNATRDCTLTLKCSQAGVLMLLIYTVARHA